MHLACIIGAEIRFRAHYWRSREVLPSTACFGPDQAGEALPGCCRLSDGDGIEPGDDAVKPRPGCWVAA
jgi:hypothetical protein